MLLKKFLGIQNMKELFLKDRLGLVKEIVKASLIRFPFQNITCLGAYLPLDRKIPTYQQVLLGTSRGEGGLCSHLNNFILLQLTSLGYDVSVISGCFRRTGIPMSHFLVKLRIPGHVSKELSSSNPMALKEDRTYTLDIGCGIPLQEPICLEKLPYRATAGGLHFRYERVDENTVQRVNENGDALMGPKPSTFVSPQDYTINVAPRLYPEFSEASRLFYLNPRSAALHQGVYCSRYLHFTEDDFEMVAIRGKELIIITKETRKVQSFPSLKEVEPMILKYFPMINPEEVGLAVKNFSIPFEEALKMSSKSSQRS